MDLSASTRAVAGSSALRATAKRYARSHEAPAACAVRRATSASDSSFTRPQVVSFRFRRTCLTNAVTVPASTESGASRSTWRPANPCGVLLPAITTRTWSRAASGASTVA